MAKVYEHITPFKKRLISFVKQKLFELDKEIKELEIEKTFFEELLQVQLPCERCGGSGTRIHFIAQDESVRNPCEDCDGRGFDNGSV